MGECLSWGPGWSTEREAQGGCIGASGCYKVMVVGWGAQRGSYSRGHPCHTGMPGHPDRGLTACLWGCQSSRQIGSFKIYNIAWISVGPHISLLEDIKSNHPGWKESFRV